MYMQDSTQSFFEAFSSGHNLVTEKANLCVCVEGEVDKMSSAGISTLCYVILLIDVCVLLSFISKMPYCV